LGLLFGHHPAILALIFFYHFIFTSSTGVKISDLFFVISSHSASSTASLFFSFLVLNNYWLHSIQNLLGLGIIKPAKVPKEYSAFDRLVFLYMFLDKTDKTHEMPITY
jgi:hypothetical protein